MGRPNPIFAALAGLMGTSAMTVMWYLAPLVRLPIIDIPAVLGSAVTGSLANAFGIGLTLHFVVGVLLGFFYVYAAGPLLRGAAWLRGLQYSLLPLVLTCFVLLPLLPQLHPLVRSGRMVPPGFLGSNWGTQVPWLLLVGHLIYGLVLGPAYAFLQTTVSFEIGSPRRGEEEPPEEQTR